jgi:hypothetical protein
LGGETILRSHTSKQIKFSIDFLNQGVQGKGITLAKAPNKWMTETTPIAFRKKLGFMRTYFDGNSGGEVRSFEPAEIYSGVALEQSRIAHDFYEPLNWQTLYQNVEIKGVTDVNGEQAYIVNKKNATGSPITDYISTNSFLLLQRKTPAPNPRTETFNEYRPINGVKIPFQITVDTNEWGKEIIKVNEVIFDTEIPDSAFTSRVF